MEFRSAYSPKKSVKTVMLEKSMTQQSFKDECDINIIMSRYLKTGVLPENINQLAAQYLDCSELDFLEAQNIVAGAKSLFTELPSSVRNQFENDPAQLLAFLNDPNNAQAAAELGLLAPERAQAILTPQPPPKDASKDV